MLIPIKLKLTKEIDGQVLYYNRQEKLWQEEQVYFKIVKEEAEKLAGSIHKKEGERICLSDERDEYQFYIGSQ